MADGVSSNPPNVLFITCDQLRYDALGCTGNPVVKTPNIDRLAGEGALFEHCFVQSPVCSPSRATLITGRYPHVHGTKYVWYDLDERETTMQGVLNGAGYETWSVGKMHFEPVTSSFGFQKRFVVEGKLFNGDDEYRRHLDRIGKREVYKQHAQRWYNEQDFGSSPSPLAEEDYIDSFIGSNAVRLLRQARPPFFFWVSFCSPHPPYDPPKPWDTRYDPRSIPLPDDLHRPQDSRIPEQRSASGGKSYLRLTDAKFQRVAASYCATISLVDEQIGRLVETLSEMGILDNTLILFISDHGEMMGHRGIIGKGARLLYDHILRVPLIVRYPGEFPAGGVISDLAQGTDIMPTILDFAGVTVPFGVQGKSLRPILKQDIVPWRDAVFSEGHEVKMVRDYHWKLIFYPGRPYGELYHLEVDPLELNNLYDHPDYERQRARMIEKLATVLIETEDPLPLPSLRPGYSAGFRSAREFGAAGTGRVTT